MHAIVKFRMRWRDRYECDAPHPLLLDGNYHMFCFRENKQSRVYKIGVHYDLQNYSIVTNSRDKPQQTPSVEKHAHQPRVVYCAIYSTLTRFTKFRVCIFPREAIPVTLLPPPRRLAPSLGLGTTWVRQLRSGSCHHPTAATKCNEQPRQATANPVSGKACSSTKGGLLRYILNTYSIHKVSSLHISKGGYPRYTMFPLEVN